MTEIGHELDVKNGLEALLFAWGEPLDIREVASFFSCDLQKMQAIVELLMREYIGRGLSIERFGHFLQMTTDAKYEAIIRYFGVNQVRKSLTNAAFEVLTAVAYFQPVTKSMVEQIRGVKSDGPLQTLLERDLLRVCGRLDQPGKPFLYEVTPKFLSAFGLASLDDLPPKMDRDEVKKLLKFTEIRPEDILSIESTQEEQDEDGFEATRYDDPIE